MNVVGRMEMTLDTFEHRCLTEIERIQARVHPEKGLVSPDDAMFALLSDAVRLKREYVKALAAPAARPETDDKPLWPDAPLPPQLQKKVDTWLKSNSGRGAGYRFYHGVFPLGMVTTWIERATRAEAKLAELAAPAAGEAQHCGYENDGIGTQCRFCGLPRHQHTHGRLAAGEAQPFNESRSPDGDGHVGQPSKPQQFDVSGRADVINSGAREASTTKRAGSEPADSLQPPAAPRTTSPRTGADITMRAFITGDTGFIGSHLTRTLRAHGWNIAGYALHRGYTLGDTLSLVEQLEDANPDVVFHLAAHANVRRGADDPRADFEVNTHGTFNLLEAMRRTGHRRIVFASSCSVYGEPTEFPTTETAPFPVQTSLYGASKVAGEALVQAYASTYGFHTTILRLSSQLGPGITRGHVVDLWRQLKRHPRLLMVKGNGHQYKSYMHVQDTIAAMEQVVVDTPSGGIYNVAGECWTVRQTVGELCEMLGVDPAVAVYSEDLRGWVGDSPHIEPSTARLEALGWTRKTSTRDAVRETIAWLENSWERG